MTRDSLLLFCTFGGPFLLIALIAGAAGYILRRVRPDLYMTDEEKQKTTDTAEESKEDNKDI